MTGENRRFPTWQWIGVTSVGVLIAVAAYAYQDTQKKIELKADKEMVLRMYDDVKDIREMMTSHIIDSGSGKVKKRRQE